MELSSAAGPRLPPSPAAAPAAPGLAPDQPLSEVFAEPANACVGLLKRLVNVKPHEYRRPERPAPRCPGQDGARRVGLESAAELRPRGRAAQRTEAPGILEAGRSSPGALRGQVSEGPTPAV